MEICKLLKPDTFVYPMLNSNNRELAIIVYLLEDTLFLLKSQCKHMILVILC